MLQEVRSKGVPCILLETYIGTDAGENSMRAPQKAKIDLPH